MEQNEQRLRNSTRPNGGRPYRCATGMAVPKTGKLKGRSSVGPVYDPDEARAVSFAQVMEVCNYVASAALLFARSLAAAAAAALSEAGARSRTLSWALLPLTGRPCALQRLFNAQCFRSLRPSSRAPAAAAATVGMALFTWSVAGPSELACEWGPAHERRGPRTRARPCTHVFQ